MNDRIIKNIFCILSYFEATFSWIKRIKCQVVLLQNGSRCQHFNVKNNFYSIITFILNWTFFSFLYFYWRRYVQFARFFLSNNPFEKCCFLSFYQQPPFIAFNSLSDDVKWPWKSFYFILHTKKVKGGGKAIRIS